MNILRKLLLKLAGGVARETHQKMRNQCARNLRMMRKVKRYTKFGGTCPRCLRSYKIEVDILSKAETRRVAHCSHCKKRPVLWWYSPYEITEIKEMW